MPCSFVVILYTALQFVLWYWCESLLPTRWYIFGAIKRCFLFLDSRVYPWSVQPRCLSWGEMGRRCGRHQVALSKTPVKNCGEKWPLPSLFCALLLFPNILKARLWLCTCFLLARPGELSHRDLTFKFCWARSTDFFLKFWLCLCSTIWLPRQVELVWWALECTNECYYMDRLLLGVWARENSDLLRRNSRGKEKGISWLNSLLKILKQQIST